MAYLGVFLASLGVNLIPIFAPPASLLMILFVVKFDLNPWIVVPIGVSGTTAGRYLFSLYIAKISTKVLQRWKKKDLEFLGDKLNGSRWSAWTFVFLYSLSPLSTTALFLTAAVGKVRPLHLLPPFFMGKLANNSVTVVTGSYLVDSQLHESLVGPRSIIAVLLGLFLIASALFIDWRRLLVSKQLRLEFKIWK